MRYRSPSGRYAKAIYVPFGIFSLVCEVGEEKESEGVSCTKVIPSGHYAPNISLTPDMRAWLTIQVSLLVEKAHVLKYGVLPEGALGRESYDLCLRSAQQQQRKTDEDSAYTIDSRHYGR
jgi:hypothetical protein